MIKFCLLMCAGYVLAAWAGNKLAAEMIKGAER